MSVNPPEGTLTIENSHLDVKGNVSAVALKLGTLRLTPSYGLDAVANVSNSTTHTLELSNATTGLVTTANVVVGKDLAVSGNATVTGDLNVSGALGILDAIYPVGTVIDRATAITDTHLNGKYKAFLGAPNQEWELVDNGHNKVLEDLSSPCNTTSLYGRATIDSVTAVQTLSLTEQDVTGSVVSGYTPVSGTDRVRYSFDFLAADDGTANPIWTHSIFFRINGGSWIEVVSSRNQGHTMRVSKYPVTWTFVLGASTANHDDGVLTETNPTLDFKIVAEEYGSTYQVKLHQTKHWQQSGADQFSMPTISITAIGTKSLEYKRTA